MIARCDKPQELMYFTITFRPFTPNPGGMEFKPGNTETQRRVEEPDSDWECDEHCPPGWRRKKYSYKSGITKKIEQVFHYLTPDNTVVRGKKQVSDYMKNTGTFNPEDFGKFHFNSVKKDKTVDERLLKRRSKLD